MQSMMPEGKWDGNFTKDTGIHGESNVWSTAQWWRQVYGFDVHVGLEWNHRSVVYGTVFIGMVMCWGERMAMSWEGHWILRSKEERETKEYMEEAGWGRKCEGWCEKGRWTLPVNVECGSGHPHLLWISNIGVSLSLCCKGLMWMCQWDK